ncbi:nucleotidyltransferase domain-containing protein [Streptomyces endophytica]|uniref:Nucleotidyltransferase domain-containing protein n=1 Tax=Streptomyces endophytica TaxID=2991496 RepID=A0ABY6PIM6_9ACTN|nr:nucleotidyltransferase domain-containing protein [Streptomyces endophytica]UZJ33744.1 nucleotidyltransferase domain-containing protein [Streptomyces endophytica]
MEPTQDRRTDALLQRFRTALHTHLPLRALWAHGSLAGGDYQEGRSDLDLIAVLDRPPTPEDERHIGALHRALDATDPLAPHLHCSYLVADDTAADPGCCHLTWAQRELFHRPVTPVTRRELHTFGRVLSGDAPGALLPPVTDVELATHIRHDLQGYWRPALDRPARWLQDVWVDLGLLTLARATVALRDGTLITKAEALTVLGELGAPAAVVTDITSRRYGPGPRPSPRTRVLPVPRPGTSAAPTSPGPSSARPSTGPSRRTERAGSEASTTPRTRQVEPLHRRPGPAFRGR